MTDEIRVAAVSHAGLERTDNEDSYCDEPSLGLFGVFDGMGGHRAGAVASKVARDAVVDFCRGAGQISARDVVLQAIQNAARAVWSAANKRPEHAGMGTTAVVCLVRGATAVIGHVGDSRAYHCSGGRVRQVTQDHTIVSELLARGSISLEEAANHPYASVLSRSLGASPEVSIDLSEIALVPGDRLLLCSDGLTGYASLGAIQQAVLGAEDHETAASALIDAALRGGGGDNVTVVVADNARQPPADRQHSARALNATAWREQRGLFLEAAKRRELARQPVCGALSEQEALQIVGEQFFQAVFHDVDQGGSIHVWTFAENLANSWLDQRSAVAPLRRTWELLTACSIDVTTAVRDRTGNSARSFEAAVLRAVVSLDLALVRLLVSRTNALDVSFVEDRVSAEQSGVAEVTEVETRPFVALTADDEDDTFVGVADQATKKAVDALHHDPASLAWVEIAGRVAITEMSGSELFAFVRDAVSTTGVTPEHVLTSLEVARHAHFEVMDDGSSSGYSRAVARLAVAYCGIAFVLAILQAEYSRPIAEEYANLRDQNRILREQLGRQEQHRAELEREFRALQGGA